MNKTIFFILCAIVQLSSAEGQLIESLKSGVVRIRASGESGSGFIIRSDPFNHTAYILTAAHVVKDDSNPHIIFFTNKNNEISCKVVKTTGYSENSLDLAVLVAQLDPDKLQGLSVLTFSPEQRLHGGESVQIIGNPMYDRPVWSVVNASIEAEEDGRVYFSGNIGEGHSGSPILLDGRLVGIVNTKANIKTTYPSTGVAIDSIYGFLKGTLSGKDVINEFRSSRFCISLKRLISASLVDSGGGFNSLKGSYYYKGDSKTYYHLHFDLPGIGTDGYIREFDNLHVPEAEYVFSGSMLDPKEFQKAYHGLVNAIKSCLPMGSDFTEQDGNEWNHYDSIWVDSGLESDAVSWKWSFLAKEGTAKWFEEDFSRFPGISIYYWEYEIPTIVITFHQYLD